MNKDYYKGADIFIENKLRKIKEEFLNDYGYNINLNNKKECHFKKYCFTNQNNVKIKPKR